MNIRLHIERLILDGLPVNSVQSPQVKAAVEAELTRLLTADGLHNEFSRGGAVPRVPATAFHLLRHDSPTGVGRQIAQSVYGGIGKTK
jgi:hypothetical protein